jgi:hypothetical protein
VLKRYPGFARYRLPDVQTPDSRIRRVLSNVEADHGGQSPGFALPEVLVSLVRGVPRSFPFWRVEIFFIDAVPWQADALSR